ncbi:MAG: hypothetical protein WC714_29265 [Candidatus Obscuribacterales bacterium]|jgi:hypothetical protein
MAKASEAKWAQAKALYEKGTSLRDIEAETEIPYKTVDNRAKKQKWVKSSLAQLIDDTVRVKTEFGTLDLAQQAVVAQEVDQRTKHLTWLNNAAMKNASEAMKMGCNEQLDHVRRADTILKTKETIVGKTPDTVINNQQAVILSTPEFRMAAREVLDSI